jgi:hypothetical protein
MYNQSMGQTILRNFCIELDPIACRSIQSLGCFIF